MEPEIKHPSQSSQSKARQGCHRLATAFVIVAAVAGALAATWPNTTLSVTPAIVLLVPCVLALVYFMTGIVLRCLSKAPHHGELLPLGRAHLYAAMGCAAMLPIWSGMAGGIGTWLGPLGQIGFALGVAVYCLDEATYTAVPARLIRYGTAALTAVVLVGGFLSGTVWPLKVLEVVAIAGALMLLLGTPQKRPSLDVWLTASVAILLLEKGLDQTAANSDTLGWLTGWTIQLIAAVILLYVVLNMALHPRPR